MSWTNEEVSQFQIDNNKYLSEVNATLKKSGKPKVGIFLPGQNGDIMTAMSALKYKDVLWPDKDLVWFVNMPNADLLRYSNVSEVRPWPWAGNGLPEGTPDFWPLMCNENNRLNHEVASQYELTADLEDGYFPAPYMLADRQGWDYANCARTVFGISRACEWHPYLSFSDEEKEMAKEFISALPKRKTIMLETFCGSGQSKWDDEMTVRTIELCRKHLGGCNFIFASHPDNARFFDDDGMVSASHFTVRQTALLNDYCDLFVGISSGISVATSCWGNKPVPKIQYCGSFVCSTVSLANGPITLVTADGKTARQSRLEFENKLIELLNKIK